MSTKEKPSSLTYCWLFKVQRQNASLEVWGCVPVGGLCLTKPSLCTARLWGNVVRLARTCSGVFLVIFANCRKTEGYLTGHKVCWANAFNQRKEFEAMLYCMPVVSMKGCWVPQDQLCFSVTRWPCAGKRYRVAVGVCLSQRNVQLGVLPPVQDWLVFLVGFWCRKSKPHHQWTTGWVQCVCHTWCVPRAWHAQLSIGGQRWVQSSSFPFSCVWCWHSLS